MGEYCVNKDILSVDKFCANKNKIFYQHYSHRIIIIK